MFGMVGTSSTLDMGFMQEVAACDVTTLLPNIQAHVSPNTVVNSEQWRPYNQVGSLAGISGHGTLNQSLHFGDPMTGTYTQHIESYWIVENETKEDEGMPLRIRCQTI